MKLLKIYQIAHFFNIVVIYTSETDLSDVIKTVYLYLRKKKNNNKLEEVEDLLFDKNIDSFDDILNHITKDDLINYIENKEVKNKNYKPIFKKVKELNGDLKNEELELIVEYFLWKKQIDNVDGKLDSIKLHQKDNKNSVLSDNIFVTVINKKTKPENLFEELKANIASIDLDPISLVSLGIKIIIENFAFNQSFRPDRKFYHAAWLYNVINGKDRVSNIREFNTRIVNDYSSQIIDYLEKFSSDVISLLDKEEDCCIKKYYNIDVKQNKNVIFQALNQYLSCENDISSHLNIGMILYHNKSESEIPLNNTYWICLNNSCDLVPTRPNPWEAQLNGLKPFTAVKLIEQDSLN